MNPRPFFLYRRSSTRYGIEKRLNNRILIMKGNMLAKNCSVQLRIAILNDEIEIHKSRLDLKKSKIDTLYLRDAIGVIERRVVELELRKETIREETLPYE
jgi:hypothetical protein